jgi:hypothetical protein
MGKINIKQLAVIARVCSAMNFGDLLSKSKGPPHSSHRYLYMNTNTPTEINVERNQRIRGLSVGIDLHLVLARTCYCWSAYKHGTVAAVVLVVAGLKQDLEVEPVVVMVRPEIYGHHGHVPGGRAGIPSTSRAARPLVSCALESAWNLTQPGVSASALGAAWRGSC